MDNLENVIRWLRKYQISFTLPIHIGTRDETLSELDATLALVDRLDLRPNELEITFGTYIQPGSVDYERLLERYPDFKWFGNDKLDHGYVRAYTRNNKFYTVFDMGAAYNAKELGDLKTWPLQDFRVDSDFGWDMKNVAKSTNFSHIAAEVYEIGINRKIYTDFISAIQQVRAVCGGMVGCEDKTRSYLVGLNSHLSRLGKKFVILTTPFYYERTLRGMSLEELSSFAGILSISAEEKPKIEPDWLVLHMNPVSLAQAPDLLDGYTGIVLNTGKLYENPELLANIAAYDAESRIRLTREYPAKA